ncbi:transmembrane protein 51b [Esox lucius]|uniref:Transmembrane protein 51b n=1 Tax=Esox lucius TaxID=8010 RepID=A0AAY5KTC0_ESOLU|nr:transmembrane protein 51b [Esox lucius]XP_010900140.1 transmembrane protein 51b [Esox lucius]XP_010900141.1 transmembrane protein 51b [Esox lucius]
MCSSGVPAGSSRRGSRSGSSYALCALGVGLIALGIIMIVWTVVPADAVGHTSKAPGNFSVTVPVDHGASDKEAVNTSSIAYVLVGSGGGMLLLSICLGVRNKRRERQSGQAARAVSVPFVDHEAEAEQTAREAAPAYDVPSYEEAVTSGQYPIRQSNLRQSTSQLPSYEDLISAVENEGLVPAGDAAPSGPTAEPQPAPGPAVAANPPVRSGSRASRILRPLRVRRIKSEKLHLKDFRLNIRSPADAKVTIEPITPPPQYDDKMPEF